MKIGSRHDPFSKLIGHGKSDDAVRVAIELLGFFPVLLGLAPLMLGAQERNAVFFLRRFEQDGAVVVEP